VVDQGAVLAVAASVTAPVILSKRPDAGTVPKKIVENSAAKAQWRPIRHQSATMLKNVCVASFSILYASQYRVLVVYNQLPFVHRFLIVLADTY
jgi:hypothetical protein